MAQIKIYSHRQHLAGRRQLLSDTIHDCVIRVLGLPADKRFHRFIALEAEDFIHPADRSERYTIIEISLFTGRTTDTKKALIRALFAALDSAAGIAPQDLEITLHESPRENWGIRGLPGDELALAYRVEK